MKSLNKYVSESLYDNLGIGTTIIDNWINIYNNQSTISSWDSTMGFRERENYNKAHRDGDRVVVNHQVDIIDDNLLDAGYIPDYIHIVYENTPGICRVVNVYNDNLKSLNGIEFDSHHTYEINLCQARSFNDWSAIVKLHTKLTIWADYHYPEDCSGLKTKNTSTSECMLTVNMLNKSNVGVLDNIKGCVFYTVYLNGDVRGVEDKLSGFFKNNVFKGRKYNASVNLQHLDVNNFNFLLNLDQRTIIKTLSCELPKGSWMNNPDTFKSMFDGFINSQIETVMVMPKSRDASISVNTIKKRLNDFKDTVILDKKILLP